MLGMGKLLTMKRQIDLFTQLAVWLRNLKTPQNPSSLSTGATFLNERQLPSAVYAIGDVHGCYDLLCKAENEIVKRATAINGDRLIVVLGDVIDRGPKSAQVIDHLIAAPPAGFRRICLAGNHEMMMLQFLANPKLKSSWLKFGGLATLESYGISTRELRSRSEFNGERFKHLVTSYIPEEHLHFLRSLPLGLRFPGLTFVHAGLHPDALAKKRFDTGRFDLRLEALHDLAVGEQSLVVHGHHAQKRAEINNNCLNLDTGAYATGRLSFAEFTDAKAYSLFEVGST